MAFEVNGFQKSLRSLHFTDTKPQTSTELLKRPSFVASVSIPFSHYGCFDANLSRAVISLLSLH
jgi:hypothetical protein